MLRCVDAVESERKARFAYALRRAREKRGMTVPQLAAKVGVARGTVNRWEDPYRKDAPSILYLGALSAALAVDPRLFAVLPAEPPSEVDAYLVGEAALEGLREGQRRAAPAPEVPEGQGAPARRKTRLRAVDGAGSSPQDHSDEDR